MNNYVWTRASTGKHTFYGRSAQSKLDSCRSLTRVWSVNFRSSEQCLALRAHLRPRHQKNHTRCTARPRCLVSHRCWLWLLTAVVFSSDHVKPMPRCGIVWLYIDTNTSQGHLCHLIMFLYIFILWSLLAARGEGVASGRVAVPAMSQSCPRFRGGSSFSRIFRRTCTFQLELFKTIPWKKLIEKARRQ